jgi:hypothetical protein
MSSEAIADLLEQARLASNEVCDKATHILRRTLPDIHALQQEGSIFSPRLMGLMCSRAEGKLPESDHQLLGAALGYAEEEQLTRMVWVRALKNGDPSLDVPCVSRVCGEAVGTLRRMSAELDGVLERMGGS